MEVLISRLLQGGVLLSSATISLGLLLLLATQTTDMAALHTFPGTPPPIHTLDELGQALSHGTAQGIITAGLLILIATPVVRVAASVVAFALEGDTRFVLITLFVLCVLMASFALGWAE
jgi:uncharacterized membrane protein